MSCVFDYPPTYLDTVCPTVDLDGNIFIYRSYSAAQILSSHENARLSGFMLFIFYIWIVGVVYFNRLPAATVTTGNFLRLQHITVFNLLKPNDIYIYIYRTAQLTSRRYILNIYSTNIHNEYFKHAV